MLCGTDDTDCGVCIADGGTPAQTCSGCDGQGCNGGVLCAGDPNECSTDIVGGCCIDNELITGCFVMTAAACAQPELEGIYRDDGTNCDAPCPAKNGSDCTMSSDCESTHCADGVCCDSACTGEFQRCNLPDQLGVCVAVAAPAPILSMRGAIAAGLLLFGVAVLGLGRRRRGG